MGNGRDAMSEDNAAKVAETTAMPVEAPKKKLFPRFLALADRKSVV